MRRTLTVAAITTGALLLTHGTAFAHTAEASCIEGTDTYTVIATSPEPGFSWVDNGDGTWTATWSDGVTVTGAAPEACLTPATTIPPTTTTTTTTISPPVDTTVPPPSTVPATTPAPGPTTLPPSSGPEPAATTLPATGRDATVAAIGLALFGAGLAIVAWTRKRATDG